MTGSDRGAPAGRVGVLLLCLGLVSGAVALAATSLRDRPAAGATSASGVLYAWGDDDAGQLGIGSISDATNDFDQDSYIPEWSHMPAGVRTVAAAGGQSHTLAVTSEGAVYATGYNSDGQLGDGTRTATVSPVPASIPTGVKIVAVSAGYKQSMALSSTGAVYTWGSNQQGQAGTGSAQASVVTPSQVSLPGGAPATSIAAGFEHDLAVTASGAVYAWGLNSTGQLGDGSTTESSVPVHVQLPPGAVATAVAGAAGHSLALTSDGAVYAWGDDTHGQLGDGNTVQQDTPVAVQLPAGVTVTAIAAGDGDTDGLTGGYSLALTSTGAIYAWGDNASGDLGDDSTVDSDVPVLVQLPAGIRPVAVTAGGNRCHLLTANGEIYDWGSGEKLGINVNLVPTRDILPSGMTPVAIADGPAAEQYLAIMRGSALTLAKTSTSSFTAAGQPLAYSYAVTNSGTTTLQGVSIADSLVKSNELTCPETTLEPGSTETCAGSYVTTGVDEKADLVTNEAVASATGPKGVPAVSNQPTFTLSAEDGPTLSSSSLPTFRLGISEAFNVTSSGSPTPQLTETGTLPAGLTFVDNPDGSATLSGKVTGAPGSYPIVVQASDGGGPVVSQVVPITVVPGGAPSLVLGETVNGRDGAPVPTGSPVTWGFVVSNVGRVALTDVSVTDPKVPSASIDCGDGGNVVATLSPGAIATCTATGTATTGLHVDKGTATAAASGASVTGHSSGSYEGFRASLKLAKTTNGSNGLHIPVGSPVTWSYVVTNDGSRFAPLTNVTVTDNRLSSSAVDCGDGSNVVPSLAPSMSATCTASGTAVKGWYHNTGTVTAAPPVGPSISASSKSSYLGTS